MVLMKKETIISSDGAKYVGELKNGRYHGKGALTLPDGRQYVGKFKDIIVSFFINPF